MSASLQKNLDNILAAGKMKDEATFSFPTINSSHRTSGKPTYWTISVRAKSNEVAKNYLKLTENYFRNKVNLPITAIAEITVESGLVGGKVRDVVPTIVRVGKNIGKANETSVFTQAILDANGIYTKKLRGVHDKSDDAGLISLFYPPMLATGVEKIKDGIEWSSVVVDNVNNDNDNDNEEEDNKNVGIYVDPKLNGVRLVSFMLPSAVVDSEEVPGRLILYSRHRKEYHGLDYIRAELLKIFAQAREAGYPDGSIYLDGELYKHGESLQTISGIVRRSLPDRIEKGEDTVKLIYNVFDCFFPAEESLSYVERMRRLSSIGLDNADQLLSNSPYSYVVRVPNRRVFSEEELDAIVKEHISDGYEGSIIRYGWAPYEYSNNGHHSRYLLKKKQSFDEEYTLIGFSSGKKGKAADSLMLIMSTIDGKEFNVTPMGTIESRKELLKKFTEDENYFDEHFRGKMITVRYDELSDDGIPVRARALAIRDYE